MQFCYVCPQILAGVLGATERVKHPALARQRVLVQKHLQFMSFQMWKRTEIWFSFSFGMRLIQNEIFRKSHFELASGVGLTTFPGLPMMLCGDILE